MLDQNESPEINDDVESILAEVNQAGGGQAAPGSAEGEGASASGNVPQGNPAAPAAADEFAFSFGGKEIKATRDQMIKWAQMGYDAPNRLGALNKQIQELQTKEKTWSEVEKKYGEIDKYARENPQWLDYIMGEYQKAQGQRANDPNARVIQELQKKISELEGTTGQWKQERDATVAQQEDQAYLTELDSIKKQYPKVDFDSQDPRTGKSLEYQILEHAQANGIRNFKTAFRDFYHDELMKMGSAQAKESVAKNLQQKSKLGIQSLKTAPTTRNGASVKGKSYHDLEQEALEYAKTLVS